jgi:hypothetical protein
MKKKLTLPKLKKKLQTIFNKYIRLRDSGGGYFTCISCSMTKTTDEMNAGHFYAVKGYDGLRFDELNVHGECASCNCFNESHLIGYAINLNEKIGDIEIQKLHKRAAAYKKDSNFKWDRNDLENKILLYKEKIALLD